MSVLRAWGAVCTVLVCLTGVTCGCSGSATVAPPTLSDAQVSNLPVQDQLNLAASDGSLDRVKTLVETYPALVYYADGDGRTPLHYAAAYGHTDIVTYLLEHGANPFAQDSEGTAPQSTAVRRGHPDTARVIANAVQNAMAAQGMSLPQ